MLTFVHRHRSAGLAWSQIAARFKEAGFGESPSGKTVQRWFEVVTGVDPANWAPALAPQFRTVHFRLCTASAVVAAPSSPERAAEVFRCPKGSVAAERLSPSLAGRLRRPDHIRIKPALRRLRAIACRPTDRPRPAALECLVRREPVLGSVGRGVRSAHAFQLSRWIHQVNPLSRFVQRSLPR